MSLSISKLDIKNKYVIAVSGGADSMALLDVLRKENYNLVVAHVNYKSRPTSDRDEEIVKEYCRVHNINFYVDYPKQLDKENFEKWARKARYRFFKKLYDELSIDYLLLAHHRDDVIETYLMKKERKSVGYFKTLPKENESFGMKLIRPFYEVSKESLRNYCLENNVLFGDDETNFEPVYARNKLRIEKLSKLTEVEKENLFNEIVLENEMWNKNLLKILEPFKNKESLTFSKLTSLDIDSQILILYDYVNSYLKDEDLNEKLSRSRILDMLDKMKNKSSVSIKLKDNISLEKEYEKLWIKSEEFESYNFILDKYEELKTPYFEITNTGKNMEGIHVKNEDYPLTIRPYTNQDVIKIKDGHKSIRRLYIDKKIPKSLRVKLPVLVNCKNEVLLIPSLYKEVERKSLQSNFFMIKYHKY